MRSERTQEPRPRMSGKAALAWLAAGVIGLPLGFLSLEKANRYGSAGSATTPNFLCDPQASKPIELGKTRTVPLPAAFAKMARLVVQNTGEAPVGDGSTQENVTIINLYSGHGHQARKESGVVFDYEDHDFTLADGEQMRVDILDADNGAVQVVTCFDNKDTK